MTITDLSPRIHARNSAAVVLYGKPDCVQCTAIERKFKKEGVEFTKVDVSQDSGALEFIKGLGFSAAPVVYVSTIEGDVHWSGYDVNEIERHITHSGAA